tara:strand:+ start:701 stop:1105 length:405 start_codon:yes stop_codon:yes gene_type:complete
MSTTDVSLINPKISIVDNNAKVTVTDKSNGNQVFISPSQAPTVIVKSPTVVQGDSITNFGFVIPQAGQGTIISSNATGSNSPFIIAMPNAEGDVNVFQINNDGVVVLGDNGATAPTPTEGGFYYRDGVFYFGTP